MRERDAWGRFIFAIHGVDVLHEPSFAHIPSSLDFSWGFCRHGARLLERLNKFNTDDWASARGGSICIWP
eukprot:c35969_g1_i1 orf=3-209(-)